MEQQDGQRTETRRGVRVRSEQSLRVYLGPADLVRLQRRELPERTRLRAGAFLAMQVHELNDMQYSLITGVLARYAREVHGG